MNKNLLASLVIAATASPVSASLFSNDVDVELYRNQAKADEYNEIVNAPGICEYLSTNACDLLLDKPNLEIHQPEISLEDKELLSQLLLLSKDSKSNKDSTLTDARRGILKNSALSLGFSVGMAMEAARFNKIWNSYAHVYDQVDFEPLLIEHESGRNILPPVVVALGDSRQISAGGRVFRIAENVYRVDRQPRFVVAAPTWRDYLNIDVERPQSPNPGLLPKNEAEASYWRVQVVRGYSNGIKTVRARVRAKYRQLKIHYTGMVTYHLLRTYNMISSPVVETTHNPVALTHGGSAMALDDSISVLTVVPQLNSRRQSWKVFPQLKKMSALQRNILTREGVYGYR